ncbi:MAG: DUF4878 domain-containing protein [Chitinophagaceae bacterium]|nr:DUF4878 domain-containing protein [Chitinophagaceae bacterium]
MKKFLTTFTLSALLISFLIGCKGKDAVNSDDPKAVLMAFFERMAKKDIDGAAKLATEKSAGTLKMMKKAMDMGEKMKDKLGDLGDQKEKKDPSEDFKNMKIGEAVIDGDNATVEVTNTAKSDKSFKFPLVKENGAWKVDFSMGTLMKMGMNQSKSIMNDDKTDNGDDNMNPSDTTNPMDRLNKVLNSDSLKKGLQKLDSLMKSIDPKVMDKAKEIMKKATEKAGQ